MTNKQFFLGLLICALITTPLIIFLKRDTEKAESKTKYCGTVVGKGYEPPSSGYKSEREPCYFLLMKENKKGMVIRINVSIPLYYSEKEGESACFSLTNYQMERYGNLPYHDKDLYGE